ncbi:hypothetical protein Vqi01_24470 [Micromonospora qiuiae]|uniref:Mycothiol-dependent maleylpyruvate isomerase metal-binding domain-containing protein n=1 Tax=Micromonospora qiuiae TaxID=502268 RepID=A0ABQ4JAU6_9ACTN|nr:hypothetical protein Vqi01_24470 [Micromonospora qiuiae]
MEQVRAAFRDECVRLGEVLASLDPADLDRPTGCVPWTVAALMEFPHTRVVEVGVHGLDLAAALDRPPWLTATAGRVIADLLTGGRRTRPRGAAAAFLRPPLERRSRG